MELIRWYFHKAFPLEDPFMYYVCRDFLYYICIGSRMHLSTYYLHIRKSDFYSKNLLFSN